jgi:hypothetical protein
MLQFHGLGRAVVVILLLFAAADLSFPGVCLEAATSPDGTTSLSGASESFASGHQCDDCFCCSRTVRTTAVFAVLPSVITVSALVVVLPEPRSLVARPVFHPPIG